MNITQRQSKILNHVLERGSITIATFAEKLQVSPKTLKKDMQELQEVLNEYESRLQIQDDKSYTLETPYTKSWWMHQIANMITYPLDDIVKLHILFSDETLTVQKIADNFYYTKSIVERIIYSEAFKDFPLHKKRNVGLVYDGDYLEQTQAIVEIFIEHVRYSNLIEGTYRLLKETRNVAVDYETVDLIFQRLRVYLAETTITYTDSSIKKMFLYLITYYYKPGGEGSELISEETQLLLSTLDLPILDAKATRIQAIRRQVRKRKNSDDHSPETIVELVETIFVKIEQELGIHLKQEPKVKKQLRTHIHEITNRFSETPIDESVSSEKVRFIQQFRLKYPIAFEAGKIAIAIIERYFDEGPLKEIEVIYIGMYIQTLLDMGETQNPTKIRAAIVCEYGFGVSNFVGIKLRQHFPDIDIKLTTSVFELCGDQSLFENIDIIFCTMDNFYVNSELEAKLVHVSTLPGENDIERVNEKITAINSRRFSQTLATPLFMVQAQYTSKDELLADICAKLEAKQLILPQFYDSVQKREQLAPTAFGVLAIPHGDAAFVQKSTAVIVQLAQPMPWGDAKVSLVCLFIVTAADLQFYKQSVGHLYQKLADESIIHKLIAAQSGSELQTIIF